MSAAEQAQEVGHTPGPWHVPAGVIAADTVWSDEATGGVNVASFITGRDWEEGDANARLIAAAPDLLAALRALMREAAAGHRMSDGVMFDALAAIGKAVAR